MDLSVITVNTNDGEKLIPQIDSVLAGVEKISCEQIISDNGSTDDSLQKIKEKFPNVKIVENGKNVGFGAANNSALKLAQGEFILFLNPDMRIAPGSLDKIVSWMKEHTDVGVASCKLVDENGKFNSNTAPRRFPGLLDQLAILLKLPHVFPSILNKYLYKGFDFDKEQEVDSVRGSFMLVRKELVNKLGWGFDPRYFIWFEDVDTCREAKRLNYKVMYTPVISCVDYVGQTFKRQPTFQKQKWFTESMIKYFKKWHPAWQWGVLVCLRPVALGMTWVGSKLCK